MSVKMLAGVGVAVVALATVGSGAALALSAWSATTAAPATKSASTGASVLVGCKAGTVDGTVLTEAKQRQFISSGATAALYQEPGVAGQPGSYWVLYPSTGVNSTGAVKPPVNTWTPADSQAARAACAPFLSPSK